jgi:hypothetical protein
MLRHRLREQVETARRDIGHDLGIGGSEAVEKPTLAEILGGDKTPEALKLSMERSEGECPLAAWMLKSSVVQNLELTAWAWDCWVLRESRKDLLMELARSQGLELPSKSDPPEGGEGGGEEKPVESAKVEEAPAEPPVPGKVRIPKRERKPSAQRKPKVKTNTA